MRFPLKHHSFIISQELTVPCPVDCTEDNITAYRWCKSPVNQENNFLPNLLEANRPPRQLKGDDQHCDLCALSFFDTLEAALKRFDKIQLPTRRKLGHTHICVGQIVEDDGVRSEIINHHFNFFEYENVILMNKFSIVQALS